MHFTEKSREEYAEIFKKVVEHPFNRQLAAGNAESGIFKTFIKQDLIFMRAYTRVSAVASAKAPNDDEALFWIKNAYEKKLLENTLRSKLLSGTSTEENEDANIYCEMYANFMESAAGFEDYPRIVAALYPYIKISAETGLFLAANSNEGNPYQEWIHIRTGLNDKAFIEKTEEILNSAAEKAEPEVLKAMKANFRKSAMYNYLFFNGIMPETV